jgi:hypothetical protein
MSWVSKKNGMGCRRKRWPVPFLVSYLVPLSFCPYVLLLLVSTFVQYFSDHQTSLGTPLHKTDRFRLEVGKDLIDCPISKNTGQDFRHHRAIVVCNFQATWSENVRLLIFETRPIAVHLATNNLCTHYNRSKSASVVGSHRAIFVRAPAELRHKPLAPLLENRCCPLAVPPHCLGKSAYPTHQNQDKQLSDQRCHEPCKPPLEAHYQSHLSDSSAYRQTTSDCL